MKAIVALQNNRISLTDKTFWRVNELFFSPEQANSHQKKVDFVPPFWYGERVFGEKAFTERYHKWCNHTRGITSVRPRRLAFARMAEGHITTLTKNENTKLLIATAAWQCIAKNTLVAMRTETLRLAKLLPEYDAVSAIYGVGEITAAQLMA